MRTPIFRRWALLAVAFAPLGMAVAEDAAEIEKKQDSFVEKAIAKSGLEKPTTVAVEGYRFVGSLPADRATALAKSLAKQSAAAGKLVHFKQDERPWEGKLTVFVFPDRSQYTAFVRSVEERRADADEKSSIGVNGPVPYIALTTDGVKPAEIEAKLSEEVAAAILNRKIGGMAKIPDWLQEGFVKLTALKASPDGYKQFKAAMKAKFGPRGPYYAVELRHVSGELTPNERKLDPKDRAAIRTAFVDYLTGGLSEAKSDQALGGFRISDEVPMPDINTLASLVESKEGENWMKKVEVNWKTWMITGKDATAPAKKDGKSKP